MVQKTPGSHARLPGVQFVKKRSFFHKPKPYLKWKRGLSPLFQAFFPLQLRFFLTQAAAFVQSQRPAVTQDCRAFLIEQRQKPLSSVKSRKKGRPNTVSRRWDGLFQALIMPFVRQVPASFGRQLSPPLPQNVRHWSRCHRWTK